MGRVHGENSASMQGFDALHHGEKTMQLLRRKLVFFEEGNKLLESTLRKRGGNDRYQNCISTFKDVFGKRGDRRWTIQNDYVVVFFDTI